MAVKKTKVQKSIDDTPERFKMAQAGYLGANIWNGVSRDELKQELNYPESLKTFKQMSYHSAINAPLRLFENLIGKTDWPVKPPQNATEEEKQQTERIREMMQDMEHTWTDFILETLTMNVYGFSVHEKVFRRRYKSNGSKYDDGLIGWKKLPIRNQETIKKFLFSEDGNEITGVKQDISGVHDPYGRYTSSIKQVNLPKSKILLFRTGRHKGDPFGKSPLRDAYLAWRYLVAIEDIEASGVAKDLNGIPVLKLPPQYLSPDASPEQKQIRAYFEAALANMQQNQQASLMLPNVFDPETKQPLFSIDLLTNAGNKGFDTTKVKDYYKNLIFTSLFADILIMGQSATGSFALGQVKNSLTGTAAESMIRVIKDVINHDLIKQTYELNGWDVTRTCSIDFDNLETSDLETFSKGIQRMSSVGMLTTDLEVINKIRDSIGVDSLPEGTDFKKLLPEPETKAGQGMKTAGEGTSKGVSGKDTSSSNLDNSA